MMTRYWGRKACLAVVATVAIALAVLAGVSSAANAKKSTKAAPAPILRIPARPAKAMTGSDFARLTSGMHESERQAAAVAQLRAGNVPPSERVLRPVVLRGETPAGETLRAVVWVMPDYLAIGSDEDFLRAPLTYSSATTIANEFDAILPTPKIVDAVYKYATIKLSPQPLPAGPGMRSSEYCLRQHELIQAQLHGRKLGDLTAGQKKDVVITNRLLKRPRSIAIYGWHQMSGKPIQPLSTVHESEYADYSHGIRLVARTVTVNNQRRAIDDVLQDPNVAPVLTYEGALENVDRIMRR
jgi:hypothetical protein